MNADPVARALAGLRTTTSGRQAVAWNGAETWGPALEREGWTTIGAGQADLVLLSLLRERGHRERRREILTAAAGRLAPAGRLLVIDHNRPRRLLARIPAVLMLWWHGHRARRAAHPTAREIAANGFVVERLLLGRGERIQVVQARRRPGA